MDRTERFYRIEQLLHDHRVAPVERFLDELNISIATFKRDLEYLRERLGAPIIWDRQERGYCFNRMFIWTSPVCQDDLEWCVG